MRDPDVICSDKWQWRLTPGTHRGSWIIHFWRRCMGISLTLCLWCHRLALKMTCLNNLVKWFSKRLNVSQSKHVSSSRALIRSPDSDLLSWTAHDWQDVSWQRQKVKVFTPNIRTGGVTESRPCHIWFGFAEPRHCSSLPSCLQRGKYAGECSEQSSEKLIYVMESLTVILLTLSSLRQEICHMPQQNGLHGAVNQIRPH